MNDKEIRKILVSYLEATHNKIRIYHEKNIGAAICDVAQGTVLCVLVVCTPHGIKCTQRRPFVKLFKHYIKKRLCGS